LADGIDVSTTDLVWPCNIVLEVHIVTQVHFAGDSGENEALLSSVGQWKLDLAIKSTRTEECWIERVGTIGCHYNLRKT
jgi:hypothetical protein